jgi:hypothetical protein
MTPAGIEPATFRFVTQHLNHCVTAVPHIRHNVDKHNKCVTLLKLLTEKNGTLGETPI